MFIIDPYEGITIARYAVNFYKYKRHPDMGNGRSIRRSFVIDFSKVARSILFREPFHPGSSRFEQNPGIICPGSARNLCEANST